MKKLVRVLCLFVSLIGMPSVSLAWQESKSDIEPMRSFVTVSFSAEATPDGKMTITGWHTKYVKANGNWTEVAHRTDMLAAFAAAATNFAKTSSAASDESAERESAKASGADGNDSLSLPFPESLEVKYHSHSYLKSLPQFVRMDVVAGLEVYVIRAYADENPKYWMEFSFSPLTGNFNLRAVSHSEDGSEFIYEVVKVEFKPVPDNLDDGIKLIPNTNKANDKIGPSQHPNSN